MQVIDNHRTMDPKEWALTIFIASLPIIGVIMLFVWAFSAEANIHKKNWAKGTLILWLIAFGLFLAFLFLFGGMALLNNLFD